jgi:hypothetical protein
MSIANISLLNTWDDMRVALNQMILITNDQTEGNAVSTGTTKFTNPSGFEGNETINVASGMYVGDGGLLSNVPNTAIAGTMENDQLQNSTMTITSANDAFVITGGSDAPLGNTITIEVGTLATGIADISTKNIAAAAAVNTLSDLVATNLIGYGAAFDQANTGIAAVATARGDGNTNATNIATGVIAIATARGEANTNATAIALTRGESNSAASEAATGRGQANTNETAIVLGRGESNTNATSAATALTTAGAAFDGANTKSTLGASQNTAYSSTFDLATLGSGTVDSGGQANMADAIQNIFVNLPIPPDSGIVIDYDFVATDADNPSSDNDSSYTTYDRTLKVRTRYRAVS